MPVLAVFDEIWEFLVAGGVFMGFIGLASFVAVTLAIYLALSLKKSVVIPQEIETEIERAERHFTSGNAAEFRRHLRENPSTVAKIGSIALSERFSNREEANQAVEANAREEVVKMQSGMGVLEVIITIAPLLGLLGTVSGLVSVFATLGASGENAADPARLAAGIAIALNTTIAGLVVAILAVIVHSIFTRRIENLAARLEVLSADLLQTFYKCGGPELYGDTIGGDPGAEEIPPITPSSDEFLEG